MKHSFHKSIKWSTGIAVITLVLAAIFSVASTLMLSGVSWGMGMVIVLIIVLIGVFFDIIGVASTAANEVPFHAMASEKFRAPGTRSRSPGMRTGFPTFAMMSSAIFRELSVVRRPQRLSLN